MALALAAVAAAGTPRRLDVSGGTAWNAVTPLVIRQEGEQPLRFPARYSTRPLADVPYYAIRFGFAKASSALPRKGGIGARPAGRGRPAYWELELVHHKLYLDNPPPEVEMFKVTHGFNLISLGRAWPVGRAELRFGVGPMLTHPINTVRGRAYEGSRYLFGTGWLLSGAGFQLGAGHRWRLGRGVELVAEAKATAVLTEVPVAGGRAELPNAAVHILLGLGFRL